MPIVSTDFLKSCNQDSSAQTSGLLWICIKQEPKRSKQALNMTLCGGGSTANKNSLPPASQAASGIEIYMLDISPRQAMPGRMKFGPVSGLQITWEARSSRFPLSSLYLTGFGSSEILFDFSRAGISSTPKSPGLPLAMLCAQDPPSRSPSSPAR